MIDPSRSECVDHGPHPEEVLHREPQCTRTGVGLPDRDHRNTRARRPTVLFCDGSVGCGARCAQVSADHDGAAIGGS